MKETSSLLYTFLKLFITRPGSGLIILIGVAGVTAILTSLFIVANAFESALATTGHPDRALILRSGSTSEINGNVALEQFSIVRELPEVRRQSEEGLASRETYVTVNLPMRASVQDATLPLRGVQEAAFKVRPEVRISDGTTFSPGKYELIAGLKAAQTFAGLGIGETIWIRGKSYLVKGHFTANGSSTETELWMDERLLAQTLGRGETFSSILVRINDADQFDALKARLATDRRLTLSAYRESTYYQNLAAPTTGLIQGLGLLVGIIMGMGAVAAAINSMQAALESRAREIATLRALGFGRLSVLTAVLMECTILSLFGSALALVGVFILFDGQTFSTVAASTTSGAQVAFEFEVTTQALFFAGGLAVLLGLIGGLIPGVAAVRRSLPQALR